MNTTLRILLAACLLLAPASVLAAPAPAAQPPSADIEAFVREGCPHCANAKEFLARLQAEQPGLNIAIRDVGREPAALARLEQLARAHDHAAVRVPTFAVRGQLIVGYSDEASTGRLIRDSLTRPAAGPADGASCTAEPACGPPQTFSVELLGHTLSLEQVGLPLFTVVLGLLDGFNPCSMWVLILMLSLLAPMQDRARMFAVAGTFVAVQGAAYFLLIAAWLNLFLLVGLSRASEVALALLALFAGALNLKDCWRPGWGLSLSIPSAAKPGIYARIRRILQSDRLTAALVGTVVLGILVQLVELMCSSGFPALFTRILTLRQLDSAGYYGYLLLYDLAYMLDDLAVLAIGVITLSQRRLQQDEGRWLKLASGAVMVALGLYLLLR